MCRFCSLYFKIAKRAFILTNIALATAMFSVLLILTACTATKHASVSNPPNNIQVEITTNLGDKQEYVEGDEISFLVSISADAYLLIVYEDSNKRVWQLLPNDFNRQAKFSAGMYIPIPNSEQPYRFRATAPFGKESLTVFASNKPFPILHSTKFRNGLALLDISTLELDKNLGLSLLDGSNTLTTSSLVITTRKRR